MTMNDIQTFIANVGFPAVAYFLMVRQMQKMTEAHEREVSELSKVINSNTNAITTMVAKMEGKKSE